jgi:hypothetical protein
MSEPLQENLQECIRRVVQLEEHARLLNQRLADQSSLRAIKIPQPLPYSGDPYQLDDWLFQTENYINR